MTNWKRTVLAPAFLLVGVSAVGGMGTLSAAPAQPNNTVFKPSFTDNSNNTYTIGPDGRLIKEAAPVIPEAPAFEAFRVWSDKYKAAPAQQKASLESEGVRLATERREAMAKLIPQNPKRALELSVGLHERQNLPASVVQQLEEILRGRGAYSVLGITRVEEVPVPGGTGQTQKVRRSSERRTLTFGGHTYTAYSYGRRAGLLSKTNLPFHGIAIDDVVAINENPIWILTPGQVLPPDAKPGKSGTKCPVCGKDAANGLVGVVGSTLYYFDTQRDLANFAESLWEAEYEIGPMAHG